MGGKKGKKKKTSSNKKRDKILDRAEVYKDRKPLCRENSNKNKILHEMNY